MNELDLLEKAIGIAVKAHHGQKDRYNAPYILHPLRVMSRLDSPMEKIVGVLHDVVEDTNWGLGDLRREGFPEEVLVALDCVTKRAGETYEDFVHRTSGNALARTVKLADLEDNLDLRRAPEISQDAAQRMQKYLQAWHRLRNPQESTKSD